MTADSRFKREMQRQVEMSLQRYEERFRRLRSSLIERMGSESIPLTAAKFDRWSLEGLAEMREVVLERKIYLKIVDQFREPKSYFLNSPDFCRLGAERHIVAAAYRQVVEDRSWAIGCAEYGNQKE